jgi:hypothetical protein
MYQIPHGEAHILHIYICVHTPHVRDTGRSPHGAGPGATVIGLFFIDPSVAVTQKYRI